MSKPKHTSRAIRNALKSESLKKIQKKEWPSTSNMNSTPLSVWASRHFLVQVYTEANDCFRITVNSVIKDGNQNWSDHIPWDDLQNIKRAVGYGDNYAVEIYPRDLDTVNVANMRHLSVLPQPLGIGWFSGKYEDDSENE